MSVKKLTKPNRCAADHPPLYMTENQLTKEWQIWATFMDANVRRTQLIWESDDNGATQDQWSYYVSNPEAAKEQAWWRYEIDRMKLAYTKNDRFTGKTASCQSCLLEAVEHKGDIGNTYMVCGDKTLCEMTGGGPAPVRGCMWTDIESKLNKDVV